MPTAKKLSVGRIVNKTKVFPLLAVFRSQGPGGQPFMPTILQGPRPTDIYSDIYQEANDG